MTASLDWIGHVPAAVSAVHALVVLVQLRQQRFIGRKTARPRAPRSPRNEEGGCGCMADVVLARVDVTAQGVVGVRVAVGAATGARPAAGGERGPW